MGRGKIGIEGAVQQAIGAAVVARTDCRDGLLLDRRHLRIVFTRRFCLLEQHDMPRRDFTQLGVEVLRRHLLLAQDAEKGRQRRIGDAERPADHFVAVEQLGRDRAPGQHVFDDVLEFRRRDPDRAAAVERQRHVALRAIDNRTARRLRSHILRMGRAADPDEPCCRKYQTGKPSFHLGAAGGALKSIRTLPLVS